jgi:hypothetical protein
MDKTQTLSLEELENLKKERNFLKLQVRNLKLANTSLRGSYNKAMRRYKPRANQSDTETDWCISLNGYAENRGMDASLLRRKLKDADFLFVDRHTSYLKQPERFGNLVTYKSREIAGKATIEDMYWTYAGIAFLNEFVRENYKRKPKREFSY